MELSSFDTSLAALQATRPEITDNKQIGYFRWRRWRRWRRRRRHIRYRRHLFKIILPPESGIESNDIKRLSVWRRLASVGVGWRRLASKVVQLFHRFIYFIVCSVGSSTRFRRPIGPIPAQRRRLNDVNDVSDVT